MKRIAIFCDGTWNRSDAVYPTNVVKLSLAAERTTGDGIVQDILYVAGVGSGRGSTDWTKTIDRWGGGLFGWGLTENLEDAYRDLAFDYEVGDELFIFGFSRGAFTARSLCGLIRSCGIPTRENVHRIPDAISRYRSRAKDTHPDHEESFAFRREFSPWLHTSDKERSWRAAKGHEEGRQLFITYLGVWDTVGALGVPRVLPFAPHFNRGYQFHDLALSRSVLSARHAVAIDERRVTYPPTLWDNLADLNALQPERDRPYRQEWFPGDHGSVGGGGDIAGLSSHSLRWVVEGAVEAGFRVEGASMDRFRELEDFRAPLSSKSLQRAGLSSLLSRWAADRDGPENVEDVSECARMRWLDGLEPPYRPATLSKVAAKLDASASSPSGGG